MSRSTSADSGEPEDIGRGDAAAEAADGTEPQAETVSDATEPDAEDGGAAAEAKDGGAAAEDDGADAQVTDEAGAGTEKAKRSGADRAEGATTAATSARSSRAVSARSARATGSGPAGRTTSVRAAEAGKGRATSTRADAEASRTPRPGLFARIVRFVREVIAELRKVVTPTRNELFTYSAVVVVFLIIMMAYVGLLDYGVGRLVLWAFGG